MDRALKNDDLPTLGRPRNQIPIFKLLPGLPSSVFFSAAAAFLGGILDFFFAAATGVEKILREQDRDGGPPCTLR